jgi:hypothetical protein
MGYTVTVLQYSIKGNKALLCRILDRIWRNATESLPQSQLPRRFKLLYGVTHFSTEPHSLVLLLAMISLSFLRVSLRGGHANYFPYFTILKQSIRPRSLRCEPWVPRRSCRVHNLPLFVWVKRHTFKGPFRTRGEPVRLVQSVFLLCVLSVSVFVALRRSYDAHTPRSTSLTYNTWKCPLSLFAA